MDWSQAVVNIQQSVCKQVGLVRGQRGKDQRRTNYRDKKVPMDISTLEVAAAELKVASPIII